MYNNRTILDRSNHTILFSKSTLVNLAISKVNVLLMFVLTTLVCSLSRTNQFTLTLMVLSLLSTRSCNLPAVQTTAHWPVETTEATSMPKEDTSFCNLPFLNAKCFFLYFSVTSSSSCLSLNNYCYPICLNAVSDSLQDSFFWNLPPIQLRSCGDLFGVSLPPIKTFTYVKGYRPSHLDTLLLPLHSLLQCDGAKLVLGWAGLQVNLRAGMLSAQFLKLFKQEMALIFPDLLSNRFWWRWRVVYHCYYAVF